MTATMTAAEYQSRTTEAEMLKSVLDRLELLGGRLFHLRDARKAPELEDLTDWIILLPPRVFFIEAKSKRRQVTVGQVGVLALLAECSRVESGVVRPVPRAGEISFDAFLEWLGGEGS